MIFARDKSQMCNNLLQFAHVYAWGREHDRRVISMRFSYKYPFFKIQSTEYAGFGWYLFAKYAAALKLLPTASFKHANCDHKALEQKMMRHKHIVVSGWNVRFYDLFLKYRNEICDLFSFRDEITHAVDEKLHDDSNNIRLGVHIRRGDYKEWQDGRYYYDDETYIGYVERFIAQHAGKTVSVYICGNDPHLDKEAFIRRIPNCTFPNGNAAEDLCLLSRCDYIIGPPSTFSLVAAMYRDIDLCWMIEKDAQTMQFHKFEKLFREIR